MGVATYMLSGLTGIQSPTIFRSTVPYLVATVVCVIILTIEFYPAEEDTVIYYWSRTDWEPCSNLDYSGGCIIITITDSTSLRLVDLVGLPFAVGKPLSPPSAVGGEAYPVNKLGILAPWIALIIVFAASGFYLFRRRVNSGI